MTDLRVLLHHQRLKQQVWFNDLVINYLRENKTEDTETKLDHFLNNPDYVPRPDFDGPFHKWKQHVKGMEEEEMRTFDARLEQLLHLSQERWQYL